MQLIPLTPSVDRATLTAIRLIHAGGELDLPADADGPTIMQRIHSLGGAQVFGVVAPQVPATPVAPELPAPSFGYSAEGDARSLASEQAAIKAGFSPEPPIYRRGTRVNSTGVANAATAREEWERLPLAVDACRKLEATVRAEERSDLTIDTGALRMTRSGKIHFAEGKVALLEESASAPLWNRAASAAGVGSPGAALNSWAPVPGLDEARARAFNHLCAHVQASDDAAAALKIAAGEKPEPSRTVLRTRKAGDKRAIFAAVSPGYTALDADALARIGAAVTAGSTMRGDIAYNGRRVKMDFLAHSDVRPDNYVAGEFFRAGVRLESDDTGHGGIKVSAVVWRNLCLNLIIVDQSTIKLANLRHIGDERKLIAGVEEALMKATDSIGHFLKLWGIASAKPLIADVAAAEVKSRKALADFLERADREAAEARDRTLLEGIFRGLAKRDLVPVGVRRVEEELPRLLAAHDDPRNRSGARTNGPTRASVANALTLYAHAYQGDAFLEADLESAAGELLAHRGPLPWMAERELRA